MEQKKPKKQQGTNSQLTPPAWREGRCVSHTFNAAERSVVLHVSAPVQPEDWAEGT